ncbi:hypothetical protein PSHT_12572 [Puccinia striiformis]|uniref:Uncharacterized protein n=1 Tax=Puccinia striiformis TaxID=27350 RepID=A0A2S4UVP2_9BASI|nr:hypothetical protein PSHT_12572 [Puccinia striiformis]
MSKAPSYRINGTLVSSTRTRNQQLRSKLPDSRSPLCQALYDFIHLLLGIKEPSDPWPSSPTHEQLALFTRDWRGGASETGHIILLLTQGTATNDNLRLYGKKKVLHESNQTTFLELLQQSKFPHACFDWNADSTSPWNVAFSGLILRHWNRARLAGAFHAYPMDPAAAGEPPTLEALITRWFDGRRDEIRKEERNPGASLAQKKRIKSCHWRKQLALNRTETLRRSKVAEKFKGIFKDPLCNSDTETLDDGTLVKVKLKWRSESASLLAAKVDQLTIRRKENDNQKSHGPGQLLENRRQNHPGNPQTSRREKVPRCMAVDFYNNLFLGGLVPQAQDEMCAGAPLVAFLHLP